MCGRYTLKDPRATVYQIASITGEPYEVVAARYNVSPSQSMPVIRGGTKPKAELMRWGYVPFWEKTEKIKIAPINARSEEAFERPMFRQSIQRRRCAIPADGFYEWRKIEEKVKVPYHITRRDRAPFLFAGIYEEENDIRPATYLLFTCAPNGLMAPIHNRMPTILAAEKLPMWLSGDPIDATTFETTCLPYPSEELEAYPVRTIVNRPANDGPECVMPVA